MAISALTLIPTPGAWMSARDLVIGDYVFGADGLPKQITLVQAYTPAETFWVELDDGLGVQGDKEESSCKCTNCKAGMTIRRSTLRVSTLLSKKSPAPAAAAEEED